MPRKALALVFPALAAVTLAACAQPGVQTQSSDPYTAYAQAHADNEAAKAGDRAAVERVIRRTFPDEQEKAVRVAQCESGLNPWARNPSGASGVFQLMMPTHQGIVNMWGGDVFDAVTNINAAKTLRDGSGWGPWVCQ